MGGIDCLMGGIDCFKWEGLTVVGGLKNQPPNYDKMELKEE